MKRGDDGGNSLIGLAALGAAGAGFAAVKAVALSMEAGDAEVVVGLQKHAREMGIEEGLIAEVMDAEDSQAALTELILDTESALCLNRGSDGEIIHRDIAACACDMCKRTLSSAQAHIVYNIVDEHWLDKSERPTQDTQAAIRDAVTTALRTAGHLMTYTKRHMKNYVSKHASRSRRLSNTLRQARDRAILQVGPDATNAAIMLASGMRNEEERRAREQEREQEWRAREAMMPLWDAGKDLLGKTFWERREQERRRTLAGREQERRAREQERELRGRAASSAIDQVSHSATTTPLLLLLLP